MSKLFDQENPVFKTMSVVFSLIHLNLLTLVCSLPIFTAGAAFTAMHRVLWRLVRHEETYITKEFLDAFRRNFRQASVLWLCALLSFVVLGVDIWVVRVSSSGVQHAAVSMLVIVAGVVCAFFQYSFILLSRYECSLPMIARNAALLMLGYFPRTLGMLLVLACFGGVYAIVGVQAIPLALLSGVALPQYLCALLYEPILKKLG